jgi:hypothetical protein
MDDLVISGYYSLVNSSGYKLAAKNRRRRGFSLSNLSREFKKSSIDAYKRRKTIGGIYAIRCRTLDTRWVGKAPNLSTIWNRLTFELSSDKVRCRSLQEAWKLNGADNLVFEVVEEIDAEELSFALERVMKERLEYWCGVLAAHRLD